MNITVIESIFIARPPEAVWDYTQDWSRRPEWDAAVVSAKVVGDDPRTVEIQGMGGVASTVVYKQYDRPKRTSLAVTAIASSLVTGGGGAWEYVAESGGTTFRQTNTFKLRSGCVGAALAPGVRWWLGRLTRGALAKAKAKLEAQD